MRQLAIAGRCLELSVGDITRERVDAIGNAANAALRGGGGVDGAIHAAAGPELMAELRRRYPEGTPTGTAVATAGHRLAARWVIHTVGPVWRGGSRGEAEALAGAYAATLRLAEELGAAALALPAISAGVYGFPLPDAARIALSSVASHLERASTLELVRFVLRDSTYPAFAAALDALNGSAGR
jgi:O-acetyl-ADP-ribose deacetylase (regulator of RNase III)